MVLGSNEEVVNPTIGKCGSASSSLQHTEAMEVEQTTLLTKTQRHRQQKKEDGLACEICWTSYQREGRKDQKTRVSTTSPNTAGLPKKQWRVECHISLAQAVKMAIVN